MTTTRNPQELIGTEVVDSGGDRIGKVGNVYVSEQDQQPQWITVRTGLFGHRESFVPLAGAQLDKSGLHVATTKEMVKAAPQMTEDGHLSESDGSELYRYYGMPEQRAPMAGEQRRGGTGDTTGRASGKTATGQQDRMAQSGKHGAAGTGDRTEDRADGTMVRSEEQLKVGVQQHETGRVRLRKHVVTEEQQVTVPVMHEEVRIEREPITDGDPAARGARIGEQDAEVVLHEQRPVVQTETVAVEKVRLGKQEVTEQQTVSGQVRKERIDVEDRNDREDNNGRTGRSGR